MPAYKSLELTKKNKLLEIIKNDELLNFYIPDKQELSNINREFLLSVILFYFRLFTLKDQKFGKF